MSGKSGSELARVPASGAYEASRVGAEWAYSEIVGESKVAGCKGVEEAVMAVGGIGSFAEGGRP